MLRFNLGSQAERIICPECRGHKTVMYFNDKERLSEDQICDTCKGEGIVIKITTIQSIEDARKTR